MKAREDRLQEDDGAVHVSKLSRGCARFEEADAYEEDPQLLIENLLKGNNNAVSWLLGQLIHHALENELDGSTVDGCKVMSEKEIDVEVTISCEPHKVRLKGHVDLYVKCPDAEFAIELKYRSTGELGIRSYYQTRVYSAALGVPVYVVMFTPTKVHVERVEEKMEFLERIVSEFVCKGYIEDIVYNPDSRPCTNCIHKESCEIWRKTVNTIVGKVKGARH